MRGSGPILAMCIIALGSLSACESDSATVTTLEQTPTTLTARETASAFRECLNEAGVGIPPIRFGPDDRPIFDAVATLDTSEPSVREALTGCVGPLAQRGLLEMQTDPALRDAVVDDLTAFGQCMRDQGIANFPNPVEGYDGSGAAFPSDSIPRDADGYQGAVGTCRDGGSQ